MELKSRQSNVKQRLKDILDLLEENDEGRYLVFKEFLKDDCFNDFHSLNLNNPDPIDTAILNFDIEKAFDLSHKQNESRKMQIFVKKAIRKIASIF